MGLDVLGHSVINFQLRIFNRLVEVSLVYKLVHFFPLALDIQSQVVPLLLESLLGLQLLDVLEQKLDFFSHVLVAVAINCVCVLLERSRMEYFVDLGFLLEFVASEVISQFLYLVVDGLLLCLLFLQQLVGIHQSEL